VGALFNKRSTFGITVPQAIEVDERQKSSHARIIRAIHCVLPICQMHGPEQARTPLPFVETKEGDLGEQLVPMVSQSLWVQSSAAGIRSADGNGKASATREPSPTGEDWRWGVNIGD